MSKHTPAPWKICGGMTPHFKAITSSQGYIVFSMADRDRHTEHGKTIKAPDYDTQSANARLISAAPDLLEALKNTLACLDNLDHVQMWNKTEGDHIDEAIDCQQAIRHAIQKATQGE
jgi:hypothetical protein